MCTSQDTCAAHKMRKTRAAPRFGGAAHCNFTKKYKKGDKLKIKNVSVGPIVLMPNYNRGIGSIISICSIN